MLYTPHNQKTMTLKLKRIDVCDILLALTAIKQSSDAEKWGKLHDKIREILDEFDEKNFAE